ncbi:MAG: Gfo/Idh/MocA family oxidoreductase [Kiritimatiellae bacterium]|nr:Gfo/Idh/MocA family oxidoreductase [Kiritimatiellia bacterium]
MSKTDRRNFIKGGAGAFFIASAKNVIGAGAPSNRVRVAVMGCRGACRGIWVMRAASVTPGVEVAAICDVDTRPEGMPAAVAEVEKRTGKKPYQTTDIRKILEMKDIDGIICETPDHWHAPLAWMAMLAGKAVYVEKPCSYNGEEGQILLDTWKKTGQVLQIGCQRRASRVYREMIPRLKELIGDVKYARCWYTSRRGTIGVGKKVAPPKWLDWEMWQGPAPRTDFHDNYVHYNWHWFRRWGTGEMGNNSPHFLDIARWGMGVDYPVKTVSLGARCFHSGDDWEWPDTQHASYQFADGRIITFECLSSTNVKAPHDIGTGCMFFGPGGSVLFHPQDGVFQYDNKSKLVGKWLDQSAFEWIQSTTGASYMDTDHVSNWVDAIRAKDPKLCFAGPDKSLATTQMAHTANLAWSTGETIRLDAKTGALQNKGAAAKLWCRDEYAKGWEPPVRFRG